MPSQNAQNIIGVVIFVGALVAYAVLAYNAKTKPKTKPRFWKVAAAASKMTGSKANEKTPLAP